MMRRVSAPPSTRAVSICAAAIWSGVSFTTPSPLFVAIESLGALVLAPVNDVTTARKGAEICGNQEPISTLAIATRISCP